VAINTTDGRRETVAESPATARAARAIGLSGLGSGSSGGCYRSRARWGADESLRLDANGKEIWPAEFFPAQRLTVHHTATDAGTEAGASDPAAIVRAIYRYHAVDLGFGDTPVSRPIVAPLCRPWHTQAMNATVVLGQQGRLVIPADIRTALGLASGDRLHLRLAGRQLVLERQQDAVAELRAIGSTVPKARSLVDELLAERRLAAAAE